MEPGIEESRLIISSRVFTRRKSIWPAALWSNICLSSSVVKTSKRSMDRIGEINIRHIMRAKNNRFFITPLSFWPRAWSIKTPNPALILYGYKCRILILNCFADKDNIVITIPSRIANEKIFKPGHKSNQPTLFSDKNCKKRFLDNLTFYQLCINPAPAHKQQPLCNRHWAGSDSLSDCCGNNSFIPAALHIRPKDACRI